MLLLVLENACLQRDQRVTIKKQLRSDDHHLPLDPCQQHLLHDPLYLQLPPPLPLLVLFQLLVLLHLQRMIQWSLQKKRNYVSSNSCATGQEVGKLGMIISLHIMEEIWMMDILYGLDKCLGLIIILGKNRLEDIPSSFIPFFISLFPPSSSYISIHNIHIYTLSHANTLFSDPKQTCVSIHLSILLSVIFIIIFQIVFSLTFHLSPSSTYLAHFNTFTRTHTPSVVK
ncbi:hypothetical protein K492DRAFT_76797 [Lichtheimia hyalospora FSU 10163]|nr:hypothetical protein K492DRAFT_76797 [Lichtheimia hyalospora FSU 10163]